jgi:hypothetical protein
LTIANSGLTIADSGLTIADSVFRIVICLESDPEFEIIVVRQKYLIDKTKGGIKSSLFG